jgi:glyoxylase-like metal-dependent hydrolase (beta-lactamase superfamily II)
MSQFANANRHAEGAAFFDDLLERYDAQLNDGQRAHYVAVIAALRAGHANEVPLLQRYGWVRETVRMLDRAKQLTRDEAFIPHWLSGVVRTQLPGFFGEGQTALADLSWCVDHAGQAPNPGWLREVHFHLATLHRRFGNLAEAQTQQRLSGYTTDVKPALFTTPFSGDARSGHQFSARSIRELVPGTVFVLSGFEFTEYYFIVSANRQELMSIDAGSRADSARDAYQTLRAGVPGLPPLTTVFVTHAHWDHVGGQRYFRTLNPAPRFIGRANYGDELALDALADSATGARFFGQDFRLEDVLAYKPDVAIQQASDMVIGGTHVSLLPVRGGETNDAMLIHMPDFGVVFAGDILMPYIGAPFAEEGSIDGLLAGIDHVNPPKPRLLLHGHEPLTRIFNSSQMLSELRAPLGWLRDQVLREMALGTSRATIQQKNLVAPTLEKSGSSAHLAYLVMRENIINRVFDQHSGYWQNGLQGLDALSDADHGAALVDYLGLSEARIVAGAHRMIADGRHELAAATLRAAAARLPSSGRVRDAQRVVYLKLMEKNQELNPFKFILYAGQIDQSTMQMGSRRNSDSSGGL